MDVVLTNSANVQREVGALFKHTHEEAYEQVATPFLYPDGDTIDVFLLVEDDTILVTDFGETMRWLCMQSLSMRLSAKQTRLVSDICLTHGVAFRRGVIETRCHPNELASAIVQVAQVASRVADVWFTFRARTPPSITSQVADYLERHNLPFERPPRLTGYSKRSWSIDFQVRTYESKFLVNVLSASNRSAARRITDRVVATWYDLGPAVQDQGIGFISLFDDTADVWTDKDYNLVESLSRVSQWSDPEGLAKNLSLPPIGSRPS